MAFVGGYNIGDLYRLQWRDTHLRIEGPAAGRLGQTFLDFWNRHVPKEQRITDLVMTRGLQPRLLYRLNDARRFLFPIRDMYVEAIDGAERRVWITNAYFIPDRVMRAALISAAERGVDVQVLMPKISNHLIADWLSRGFYAGLLRHKVRLCTYLDAMNHAKTMTVDGVWSTVGTANLDRLSQVGNYEINMEIYDQTFAQQMEQLFRIDKSNAEELTAEQWSRRSWLAKIGERILAPLRPLF